LKFRGFTLELLISIITMLVAGLGAWYSLTTKVEVNRITAEYEEMGLEQRIEALEARHGVHHTRGRKDGR
jgi:hypothetical protein